MCTVLFNKNIKNLIHVLFIYKQNLKLFIAFGKIYLIKKIGFGFF